MSDIFIPIEERLEDIPESTLGWNKDYDGQLLRVSKTTLERYDSPVYDIDKILSSFSKSLFELDPLERTILGIIGKEGSVNENTIVQKAFKKNADYSRDKVRYRLNHPKSPKILLKLSFISKVKGKQIGNLKKNENMYSLTFKGLIASLAMNKFEGNYMVKKFKDLISKWINTHNIPDFSIQFMKYHLALFMLKHVMEGSKLTGLKNIEPMFFTMNQGDPLISNSFPQKIETTKAYEMAIDVRSRFHVYSQVIRFALSKVVDDGFTKKKEIPLDKHGDVQIVEFPSESNFAFHILPEYLRNWYDNIERIQHEDLDNFNPYLTPEEFEPINQKGLRIDHFATNILAKRILKRQGIHPNFSLIQDPTFVV